MMVINKDPRNIVLKSKGTFRISRCIHRKTLWLINRLRRGTITYDMSQTTRIRFIEMAALVHICCQAKSRGVSVYLQNAPIQVMDLLRMAKIEELFKFKTN